MNNTKKEVEFTPLNSTPKAPLKVPRTIQLYQKTSRNFKTINQIKNVVIAFLVGLVMRLTVELYISTWYEFVAYYVGIGICITEILMELDKLLNYIAGGSYE